MYGIFTYIYHKFKPKHVYVQKDVLAFKHKTPTGEWINCSRHICSCLMMAPFFVVSSIIHAFDGDTPKIPKWCSRNLKFWTIIPFFLNLKPYFKISNPFNMQLLVSLQLRGAEIIEKTLNKSPTTSSRQLVIEQLTIFRCTLVHKNSRWLVKSMTMMITVSMNSWKILGINMRYGKWGILWESLHVEPLLDFCVNRFML